MILNGRQLLAMGSAVPYRSSMEASTNPERTAAMVAALMLRFAQKKIPRLGADHPNRIYAPRAETFLIAPDGLRLTFDDLVDWLVELPKPAMVQPSYMRGHIGVWPATNAKQVEFDLRNQVNVVREIREQHSLSDDQSVLLDTGDDSLVFPLSHLEVWARSFLILVGWDLSLAEASDYVAQMFLVAPGHESPGWETHPSTDEA